MRTKYEDYVDQKTKDFIDHEIEWFNNQLDISEIYSLLRKAKEIYYDTVPEWYSDEIMDFEDYIKYLL